MELVEKISNIQTSIFGYEIKSVSDAVVNIFSEVLDSKYINPSNPQALSALNHLMKQCLLAMQNADYLLLADLMEYELKPMIGDSL